jgi:hypothetical protein
MAGGSSRSVSARADPDSSNSWMAAVAVPVGVGGSEVTVALNTRPPLINTAAETHIHRIVVSVNDGV